MINISDVEVLDFHAHHFKKSFLLDISRNDYDRRMPHWRSFIIYLAAVYGCKPIVEEVDKILSKKYEGDFLEYVQTVLDREKISKVQIVSETGNSEGAGEFPKERYVWAINTDGIMDPNWAKSKGATTIDEVQDLINTMLNKAVNNGCSSLKNIFCGRRSLTINPKLTEDDANKAYQHLSMAKPLKEAEFRKEYYALPKELRPDYLGFIKPPIYEDPRDIKSLEIYQDYLLKYLTIKAGQLDLPYAFHTGGGQGPGYDVRNVNPMNLLPLLYDRDVNEAETKIVVLHGGVPFIDIAAAMVSQFPNLYIDTSWPCQTTIIRKILESNLEVNSPTKIMYGTDSNWIPELLAQSAQNVRWQLTPILNELNRSGYSEGECIEIAEQILYKNAKKLLKIP